MNNGNSDLSVYSLVSSSHNQRLCQNYLYYPNFTMSMDLKDFDSERVANVNKSFTEHESRHNTNHTEEENVGISSENTPLLHRFPQQELQRNPLTTIIVSLLLMILIAGVIIGIYLLVLQNDSG